ncbi:MAG: type II toxin-antitoxin system death-on-curing family toxin [Armatimonadetes bacterium]|nr:type II toxin-antitoxin system death-on-curing family toxin [Armatimonadota bacterium]
MGDVPFLTTDEVLEIHDDQIRRYGGTVGIRDIGLLQSAVAMPSTGVGDHYLHRDLYEMAAAYLFHIVQNHPFVDGNKRTGAVSALVFLTLNDIRLEAAEDELEHTVREVARGRLDKAGVSEFLRDNSRRQGDVQPGVED